MTDQVLTAGQAAQVQFDIERAGAYLPLWTVTERPADYPQHVVARLYLVARETFRTRTILLDSTIEGLRAQLPPTLTCLPRHADDDAVIVESWL